MLFMPQLLSRSRRVSNSTWGPIAMLMRPDEAATIARVIASWTQTEIRLARILSFLLKTERPVGLAMFMSVTGGEAQRAMLDAAAKTALDGQDYSLFAMTMKAIRPIRTRRNEYAHGVWGYAEELPNSLLWTSAQDHLKHELRKFGVSLAGC